MEEHKKKWLGVTGGGIALACTLGYLIYNQIEDINVARAEIDGLNRSIETARNTIEGTAALEREVIVLRELAEVFGTILPNSSNVNKLIGTINGFANEASVEVTAYKTKLDQARRGRAADFDRVAYTFNIEGDAFQFLALLDLLETHRRFIAIPSFKISAATRRQVEEEGFAQHKVKLDIETYKYDPGAQATPVRIEGYDRKRDLLAGEITRRRQGLALTKFKYRGARGRRDPWIDPRVPAFDTMSALSVQQQMDLVEELQGRMKEAASHWDLVSGAENVLAALVERRELEKKLAYIEEDLRRLESDRSITYVPAQKRLKNEVYDTLDRLRRQLSDGQAIIGPAKEMLVEVRDAMRRHLELGEYALALDTYRTVKDDLPAVAGDPIRVELASQIRRLAEDASTLQDFDEIEVAVGGVAIMEGAIPAALINGRAMTLGDMVTDELEVFAIFANEIEFIFRGVILSRVF
jgi:hypothetical protein